MRVMPGYHYHYDPVNDFLVVFYDLVADRCHSESYQKLKQLLAFMEMLAEDKEKFKKFERKVLREFQQDAIFCHLA